MPVDADEQRDVTALTFYVAMYVGCMECGVPTEIIGIYDTREAADEAVRVTDEGGDSWKRHGGDGYTEVFEAVLGETRNPGGRGHDG